MTQIACSAVIFDLDGVLVDSTACIEHHWRLWAAKYELDLEKILAIDHGRRPIETIRLIAPHLNAAEEAAQLEAAEAFDTNGVVKIKGAAQLLHLLPPHLWGIATSATKDTATTRINHTDLPMPKVLVTANDITRGKPDPEAYLLAAKRLGVAPKDCVVVEDAPVGITAALDAGMRVIAVMSTHSATELTSADIVVKCLGDIQISAGNLHSTEDLIIQVVNL